MQSVVAFFISSLLSIHSFLYTPSFSSVSTIKPAPVPLPSTLTLAVKRLNAPSEEVQIGALRYALLDAGSGEILVGKDLDRTVLPASTTKIMSALVVLEDMDLEATASVSATFNRDGRIMGLLPGEHIKVKDLLAGLLIHSANDAGSVLAETYPGGEENFVKAMNEKTADLSMNNTHFTNPVGFTDSLHFTTVRDMLTLAREAMNHAKIRELVKAKEIVVKSTDGLIEHRLESTNELLGKMEGLEGIKTGWTEESGECLVAQATRGEQKLISVVFNSPDRFEETKTLLEWGFASYTTQTKPVANWIE